MTSERPIWRWISRGTSPHLPRGCSRRLPAVPCASATRATPVPASRPTAVTPPVRRRSVTGATLTFNVNGSGSPVPGSGVSAVVFNLTAIGPTKRTVLTAFAGGTTRPTASNVNIAGGTSGRPQSGHRSGDMQRGQLHGLDLEQRRFRQHCGRHRRLVHHRIRRVIHSPDGSRAGVRHAIRERR